jgi:HK97 family phage major capsid protein
MSTHIALKRAFESRRAAQENLRSLYDSAEGRELNAEERSAEAAIVADIKEISGKEMELVDLAEKEARAAEFFSASAAADAAPVAEARGSLADELRSIGLGQKPGVSHIEFRDNVALVKGVATDGAELVDSELSSDLVSFLEERVGAVQAGARVLRTAGGADIVMPKVSSYSTVSGVIAEGGTIGRSAPQFETVTIGAKKVGVLVQASRELLEDAAFAFVPFVVEQATEQIARNMSAELMLGTNITSGLVEATANTVTTAGAAVTADELFDVYHSIVSGYRSNASWIMNDETIAAIRKLKDSDNQYLWQPGLAAGRPDTLLGRPVVADDSIAAQASAATSIVFGDIARAYTVRMVNALDVARSDEYAFDTDLVTWRFVARFDGALVDEKAIVVVDNT